MVESIGVSVNIIVRVEEWVWRRVRVRADIAAVIIEGGDKVSTEVPRSWPIHVGIFERGVKVHGERVPELMSRGFWGKIRRAIVGLPEAAIS